jgi:hypothetical protein
MISKEIIAQNAACNAIVQLLNDGTTYSTGHLSIYDSSARLIFWHPLSNPAFGSAIDGTSISGAIFDAVATNDATVTNFSVDDCDGVSIWTGNVGLSGSGASLQMESVIVAQDTTNSLTSAIFIVPA